MTNSEHEINNKNISNKNETNRKIMYKIATFFTELHRKTKNQYFIIKVVSERKPYKTQENNVFL